MSEHMESQLPEHRIVGERKGTSDWLCACGQYGPYATFLDHLHAVIHDQRVALEVVVEQTDIVLARATAQFGLETSGNRND